VLAFLRAAADQGLLNEVSENEYSFTHRLLQEYFSGPLRGR
jgi:predicted NACHT family NTPase